MFKSLELQLIAQVRKYEDLYDKRFRNFELKERRWQEIGNVIGISGLTAKRRWTTLKNRYLRIRKSLNPSTEWPFYNYLRFLDSVYVPESQIKRQTIKPVQQSEILFEPRLEEIPHHIRKTITSSEPIIINENSYGSESKNCNEQTCDYELKLSDEDIYTYELKINPTDNSLYGLDNIQNRIYELNNKARKVYGKQNNDDCESFAQFVCAKLRTLQTDAERNDMKQRILRAINYSHENADDGILDIVFVEENETED